MADGTTLPPGGGGDKIDTEDFGPRGKAPRSKIATGALDVDGGDVTFVNPFPVGLSDGAALVGTAANPLRIDPTGTTPTPVTQSGPSWQVTIHNTTVPVTSAQLPAALGQTTAAASLPVVLASDQGAHPVSQSGTWTVTANAGTGPFPVGGQAATGAAAAGNPVYVAGKDTAGNTQPLAVDTAGNQLVTGTVANGATDSGNPVKVGGKANSAVPSAVSAGQRVDGWYGLTGHQMVGVCRADGQLLASNLNGDGIAATSTFLGIVGGVMLGYNTSTFDRWRANTDVSLLASAARTGTTAAADQVNYNGRGVRVILNVTAAGTGGLTLAVQGKDSISGNYYQLHANLTQVTGTGLFVYDVYPGVGAAAGGITAVASAVVPRTWRVNVVHADGSSWTYSVSAVTIL